MSTAPITRTDLHAELLVGGDWLPTSSGGGLDHVNPATGLAQAWFPLAGVTEIDGAVAAAKDARRSWAAWSPTRRREVLQRIAALCREHSAELARIATLECGMIAPVAGVMGEAAAVWFDYYAGWTDKIAGEVTPGVDLNYTRREPEGVVAVILTWNGPIGSLGMKVAPALAAGCTVVLKPPELAPFSSTLFGRLCQEAGLPPGVLNIVQGGPEAGEALVRHREVAKISFTGGPTTARAIQAACAESLTPLVLELGGKSANIVFDDADIDRAVQVAVLGTIRMSGQVCHAPTRLLVQSGIYDRVVEAVARGLDSTVVGDPADPASQMGPVISDRARKRIAAVVADSLAAGSGELVAGAAETPTEGFFVRPTAFSGVDNSSDLAQQEVFGPVLAIMPFEDEEEAVELANDSPFGLAAHLQTTDLARAHRVAAELEVGNVAVNGGTPNPGPEASFGGTKDSGYGREGGRQGIEEFLRTKNVNVKLS